MNPPTPVAVILNPKAGADPGPDARKISEIFRSCGLEARITLVKKEAAQAAALAVQQGSKLVVAAGGDGTISGVASALMDRDARLGILPRGTFNHFAKDLGIPLNPEAAVRVIAAGKEARIDVGEVNGRAFLNNSSVGLYPIIVLERNRVQRQGHRKWVAFVLSTVRVLRRFPPMEIQLNAEGKEIVRSTGLVFIGNNEYEMEGLNIGVRRRLDAGQLFCYVSHATTRWQLIRLSVDALMGRLRKSHGVDMLHGQEAWIASRRRHLRVSLDGEVVSLIPPLHYRIRPAALRVMVP
jgi:YegS/Rv2252/BmrU family lipid kinase